MWRKGRVSAINYTLGTVRVEYPDTGRQSGELIVLQGKNEITKEYSMPEIDEVGVCLIDINGNGFYLGSGYSKAHPAPERSGKGMFITDYGDGTRVEYDKNSKNFKIQCSGEITFEAATKIVIKAPMVQVVGDQENTSTLTVHGTITAMVDVAVKGAMSVLGDCVAAGISLAKHIHGGITGGNGTTKPPE